MVPDDRSYHHGDLRSTLLETALKLLEEGGQQAISLRAVARAAGVSHAAPYHHFADKAALIEEMAVAGFRRLTSALDAAAAPGLDPMQQFRRTGLAYARFGVAHQALFRLMNRPELRRHAPIVDAARASYEVIERSVERCQQAGVIGPGDPARYAVTAWAAVHGVLILAMDGLLTGQVLSDEATERLVDDVTCVLGGGLVIRDDESVSPGT
jgi:AcrR family transcriptional regulator